MFIGSFPKSVVPSFIIISDGILSIIWEGVAWADGEPASVEVVVNLAYGDESNGAVLMGVSYLKREQICSGWVNFWLSNWKEKRGGSSTFAVLYTVGEGKIFMISLAM